MGSHVHGRGIRVQQDKGPSGLQQPGHKAQGCRAAGFALWPGCLADDVHAAAMCKGSALHRSSQRIASDIAARCIGRRTALHPMTHKSETI